MGMGLRLMQFDSPEKGRKDAAVNDGGWNDAEHENVSPETRMEKKRDLPPVSFPTLFTF